MKKSLYVLLALFALSAFEASAQDSARPRPQPPGMSGSVTFDAHILVDQFGYLPGEQKVAVIRTPHTGYDRKDVFKPGQRYEVRNAATGSTAFSGELAPWNKGAVEDSSGDSGWWFDFSKLDTPGTYFVYDTEHKLRSATFRIDPHVYRDVLKAAVRMYFYQRAGFAKQSPHAEACWNDAAAYTQDAEARDIYAKDDRSHVRDLSGGWFDAGDTNKYVTLAAPAVHQLLTAYQDNPAAFTDDFNIPESGNGVPDLLDEVKWELDWLQRMQYPDGSVALKVGGLNYNGGAPSQDKAARYYVPACSSSTISAAGMYAHGAYVFDKIPQLKANAAQLRQRAVMAWEHYQTHPKQAHCDNGAIKVAVADLPVDDQSAIVPTQASTAVVAAVYLYALTGEPAYRDYLKAHYRDARPYHDAGWSRYFPDQGEALLFYTSLANAEPKLKEQLLMDKLSDVEASTETYGFTPAKDLYRAFLHTEQYQWGSNRERANYGNTNLDAMIFEPQLAKDGERYRTRALEILHYFHGVNPFAMVYLSNMYGYGATRSANEIFHGWFLPDTRWSDALTSPCGPAPGFVAAGPNINAQAFGIPASVSPPVGQPPQKSFKDFNSPADSSYAVSEPAIYYQAAYVRLLSYFVK